MTIKGRESAQAWLKGKHHDVIVCFAARCALRNLPGIAAVPSATIESIALPVMRAMLTSGVAALGRTPEVRQASASAAAAARSAATAATSAAAAARSASTSTSASASAAAAARSASTSTSAAAAAAARSASTSTSAAWSEADKDATWLDAAHTPHLIFERPLWTQGAMPDALSSYHSRLAEHFTAAPERWGFWARWYEGMLKGAPLDWALQREVALIPDEDWEKGAEHVAGLIARIEKDFNGAPLDQDALSGHCETLLKQPELYHDAATSAGNLVEEAIFAFKTVAPANALPDGFGALELLPPVYTQIAYLLSEPSENASQIDGLKAEINKLHAVITQLRSELRVTKEKLLDARLSAVEVEQMRTFGERLQTTLTNVTLMGAIGMSTLLFFGIPAKEFQYTELKSELEALQSKMVEIEPHEGDGAKFEKP